MPYILRMTAPTTTDPVLLSVFPGTSEMAVRCRALDWESTTLGAVSGWSSALRTLVRTVIESPFPTTLWCGDALVLVYNDAYRTLLGGKHPLALGRAGPLVWAEIWPDIAPMFDGMRSGGAPAFEEGARFRVERVDGRPDDATFTFSLSPARGDDGAIVAFLNIAVETTQRDRVEHEVRKARAAAEEAELRMRTVFTQAPAFLAVLRGKDHVFEFANDSYYRLVGQRELIGASVAVALPEIREQGFVALLDGVLETGEPYIGRAVPMLLRKSADRVEQVYVDFVYQVLLDLDGRRSGVVAFGSDVTDAVVARREVERLLRESEHARAEAEASQARYRFLADAIPVQVWTARPDGALDFVSDRTAAFLGMSTSDLLGSGWLSALHAEDIERSAQRWTESLSTGEPYEIEFRIWSAPHSAYRWHLVRATAQRSESGETMGWFGTNTDIDDWKSAQSELQRLTTEAQEANRSKGDFLAAMSHELRTPLNAIGGYAQLLELGVRGPVTDEQKLDLRRIQKSKAHLDGLVSGVLDFAKLGAGQIELRVVSLDLESMLTSVIEMIMPQLAEKGLTLAPYDLPAGLSVEGDVDKTRQILLNLLSNALKFTRAGGTLSIAVRATVSTVEIDVGDTGIGVAGEQLERIFEPFVQSKSPLHVAGIGVGLGLAISRTLARAMHGDVSVSSVLGQGSTFTLALPRTR